MAGSMDVRGGGAVQAHGFRQHQDALMLDTVMSEGLVAGR